MDICDGGACLPLSFQVEWSWTFFFRSCYFLFDVCISCAHLFPADDNIAGSLLWAGSLLTKMAENEMVFWKPQYQELYVYPEQNFTSNNAYTFSAVVCFKFYSIQCIWVEWTSLILHVTYLESCIKVFFPKLWTILVSIWWWTLFKWYACILVKNICFCPGYAYQLSYRNCKRINSKILIMQHTAANKQPTNTIQAITFAKRFVHFTHLFSWNIICIRQNKPICHRNTYGFDG